jgi:hypothetical protein
VVAVAVKVEQQYLVSLAVLAVVAVAILAALTKRVALEHLGKEIRVVQVAETLLTIPEVEVEVEVRLVEMQPEA